MSPVLGVGMEGSWGLRESMEEEETVGIEQ